MRQNLAYLLAVVAPSLTLAAPPGYEPEENCGAPVESPAWYERVVNKQKVNAYAKFEQCLDRNRERQKRNIERQTAELEGIVSRTHENCKQAIRRAAPQPATLSFEYAKPFSYTSGLNGSGVETTDGGYSVQVTGSDIQGRFVVKCYLDKQFNVTALR